MSIYEWIEFDKRSTHYKLFQKDNIIYARALMNGWDWSIENQNGAEDHKINIYNNIKLKLREDKIRENINKRSEKEKLRMLIKRIITMIFSLIVLFAGWAAIFYLSLYQNNIQNNTNNGLIQWYRYCCY
jgi:hypothetical protein